MEFVIRKAGYEDIPGIMAVMKDAQKAMEHPEWFCSDREEYMKKHIETYGFTIVAEPVSGSSLAGNSLTGGSLAGSSLAGFFLIKFPGLSEENLGHLLNYSEEELQRTVHMDMAVVHPSWQGNGLQSRMLRKAEEVLADSPVPRNRLLATVHPDNRYSLHNMQSNGYEIVKTAVLYGGLPRYVLQKIL